MHTHSNFCDGKGPLSDYVARAQALNMTSLGFSSHAPVPFDCKWCMKAERLDEYIAAVKSLAQNSAGLEIYRGLEVDFIPGMIGPKDFASKLDYTVGSVHFVDALPDGTPWEIDGLHTLFLEGYEKIFQSNIRDVISRYYELTRAMVETSCPTVVGHIDKIKIQNVDGKFFDEHDAWYQDQINQTLRTIQKSGAIVEVNTRGLYQKKSTTPYPSPWVLQRLHEENIPITLNSDAHHPDDLTNQFPETAALLSSIGFKTIMVLHEGTWKPFSFNTHGLHP
ncbi:histidinol-phosphatase [Chryseolinea lacunae]|uniref:Histidinol-phosphatase n=1 Tax=Chryseolinea lacunae TaxID=2801331 RepID=A0ABS1KYJ3_9BACT|nr:histidinol-phosphatase [Chryseolinea lacunae]